MRILMILFVGLIAILSFVGAIWAIVNGQLAFGLSAILGACLTLLSIDALQDLRAIRESLANQNEQIELLRAIKIEIQNGRNELRQHNGSRPPARQPQSALAARPGTDAFESAIAAEVPPPIPRGLR